MQCVFTEEERADKGLRKDITYLCNVFGTNTIPEWLLEAVFEARRRGRRKNV